MIHLKKIYSILFCIFFFLQLPFNGKLTAQKNKKTEGSCEVVAIPDLFRKKDSTTLIKPIKKNFFILIPVIGSQPATGFMYGLTSQYSFKGFFPKAKYSTINFSVIYTEKKQLMLNIKNNVLLKENAILLSGDYRVYKFSQANYGLGTNIIPPNHSDDGFNLDAIKEPMDYDYIKIYQTASGKITNDYYIGGGIAVDIYTFIQDHNLNETEGIFTNHYNYSQLHGYNNSDYTVNGLSLNLVHDSRDNQINSNNGWYANINYRYNVKLNSQQHESHVLFTEYRHFIPLSSKNNQHVLGFWTYGQFLIHGSLPYLNLPAIGWDQRSRSGKGYTQGLFRGDNLVYFETEYRFPILCNQLISGTLFADFTTASNKDDGVKLFRYIQPAAGLGLRILIDKPTRTNLILNYAWGRNSKAFYLNAGESF